MRAAAEYASMLPSAGFLSADVALSTSDAMPILDDASVSWGAEGTEATFSLGSGIGDVYIVFTDADSGAVVTNALASAVDARTAAQTRTVAVPASALPVRRTYNWAVYATNATLGRTMVLYGAQTYHADTDMLAAGTSAVRYQDAWPTAVVNGYGEGYASCSVAVQFAGTPDFTGTVYETSSVELAGPNDLGKEKIFVDTALCGRSAGFIRAKMTRGGATLYSSPIAYTPPAAFAASDYVMKIGFSVAGEYGNVGAMPVLVRLTEGFTYGFSYADFLSSGADLAFTDDTGAIRYAYEVVKWADGGESLVWVWLPDASQGAKFTMWYGRENQTSASDGAKVWGDYAGAWHMDEAIDSETAATAVSADSAHGNNAVPTAGTNGDLSQMVSRAAVVGNGRVNSSTECVQQGNRLQTTAAQKLGGVFTLSGWFTMNEKGQFPRMAGNKAGGNGASGWSVETTSGSSTQLSVRGNGGSSYAVAGVDDLTAGWVHLAFVFSNSTGRAYSNGALKGSSDALTPVADVTQPFSFGAHGTGDEWSLNGAYDEIRLSYEALGESRIAAEWATAKADAGFLSAGESLSTSDAMPVLDDASVSWGANGTEATFTLASGIGDVYIVFTDADSGAVITNVLATSLDAGSAAQTRTVLIPPSALPVRRTYNWAAFAANATLGRSTTVVGTDPFLSDSTALVAEVSSTCYQEPWPAGVLKAYPGSSTSGSISAEFALTADFDGTVVETDAKSVSGEEALGTQYIFVDTELYGRAAGFIRFKFVDGNDVVSRSSPIAYTPPAAVAVSDYAKKVEYTVAGDFQNVGPMPVLVRLSEDFTHGFTYADFKSSGADLAFFNEAGDVRYAYDVEKWSADGESLIWVWLPDASQGAKFTMCYGRENQSAASVGARVWQGYTGVWHMGEASGTAVDATGHGLDGTPSTQNSSYNPDTIMVATDGVVGNARVNCNANGSKLTYMSVPNYDSFKFGGTFTISGWFKANAVSGYPRIFSRKENFDADEGFEIEAIKDTATGGTARGRKNDKKITVGWPDLTADWCYLTFVYDGSTLTAFTNGVQSAAGAIDAATDNDKPLSFGNNSNGSEASFNGKYDEIRLSKGAMGAARVGAEHASMKAGFLSADAAKPISNGLLIMMR